MRVSFLVTATLLLPAVQAHADPRSPLDGATKLTIEDLLKVAVRVAPDLKSAAFDVSLAEANRQSSEGIEDWTTQLTSTNSRQKTPSATNEATSTSARISRLLPTNGTISVSGSANRTAHTEPRATSRFVNLDFNIALSQPLLAKAGPAAAKATIRQAAHAMSAATIRRSASARIYVAQVAESYWQLALAWRRLAVVQLSLAAAEKQLATIQRGVGTGAIAKSEVLPFEQSILSRKIDIANAEGEIVAQSLALRTLVGLEIPPDAPVIRTAELPRAELVPLDNATLVKAALAISDDLAADLEDTRGAEVAVAAARRNVLPSLDLTLQADVTGVHKDYVRAFSELQRNRGYSFTAGASFTLPVGLSAAKGAHAAARVGLARARFDLNNRRKLIASEVIGLVTRINIVARTVELNEQVVKLAQQNVDSEQRKFELGKSTSNEVVRRQAELEQARLQLANVTAEAAINVAKLDAATGKILVRYGIKMVDTDQLVSDDLK